MKRALAGIATFVAMGLTASCGGSVGPGGSGGNDGGSRDGTMRRDGSGSIPDAHDHDASLPSCPENPAGACAVEEETCPGLCGACTCTMGIWACPEPPCAEPCRGPAPQEGASCGGVCCGPYIGLACDFACGDGGQVSATCEAVDGGAAEIGAWHLPSVCHGDSDAAGPSDAGATLNVGSACTADNQCHPTAVEGSPLACLGGSFVGGYCAVVPAECSGGGCPTGTACLVGAQAPDIDGGAVGSGDLCVKSCQLQSDCRSGYACCNAGAGPGPGTVCVPASLCLQGG
jgi:hypothetical protein